jgi:chromatin segregation and condensation protein Rec8/ScpA/Scc1 (kleisin family)
MVEMIDRLRNMVRSAGELNLLTFFGRAQSRRELVVAFLSVLELVRMSEIALVQSETFGEIMARATSPELVEQSAEG